MMAYYHDVQNLPTQQTHHYYDRNRQTKPRPAHHLIEYSISQDRYEILLRQVHHRR